MYEIKSAETKDSGKYSCTAFYNSKSQLIYGLTSMKDAELIVLSKCPQSGPGALKWFGILLSSDLKDALMVHRGD